MKKEDNKVTNKYKKEKIINNKKKIAVIVVVLFILIAYIIYSIINLIIQPTDVVMIENGKVSFEEDAVGYIIRDETVVKGENYKNGIVQIKAEGQKTSKDDQIFRYYSTGEEDLIKKIEEIDEKINEALNKEKDLFPNDIKNLDKEIEQKLNSIYAINDMQKIAEIKKEISNSITKKAKIAGEKSPSGSYINQLVQERTSYANKLNSGAEYKYAPTSGVVSYRVDGLEDVLTPNNFTTLNKEFLEGLNIKTGQIVAGSNESGKVVDNFKCYIATIMDSDKAKEAKVGDNVKIRLSNSEEISASIEYIADENEKERLIVFKITEQVEELINYRKITFDVIWWSCEGLKVPNTAIIEENNLSYVVRNRAGYLDKVLVKVLQKNDTYSIIDKYTTAELKELGYNISDLKANRNISLYDEILIKPNLEKIE